MACKIRIKVKKKKYIRGDNTTMKYTSIIIPFVGGLGMECRSWHRGWRMLPATG